MFSIIGTSLLIKVLKSEVDFLGPSQFEFIPMFIGTVRGLFGSFLWNRSYLR
jgi:hypothetical protein